MRSLLAAGLQQRDASKSSSPLISSWREDRSDTGQNQPDNLVGSLRRWDATTSQRATRNRANQPGFLMSACRLVLHAAGRVFDTRMRFTITGMS
jgi:hypothetical protein